MAEPTKKDGKGVSRRDFFSLVGWGSFLATLGGSTIGAYKFMFPNVLYEPPTLFKVGKPTDFPLGQTTFLEKKRIFIINAEDGFYAISSVCTHLGCNIRKASDRFECPCHGSKFNAEGNVISGPAPRPLQWYRMKLSRTGDLMVDKGDQVDHRFRLKVNA